MFDEYFQAATNVDHQVCHTLKIPVMAAELNTWV